MDEFLLNKIIKYKNFLRTIPCPYGKKHLYNYDHDKDFWEWDDIYHDDVYDIDTDMGSMCEYCKYWFCPCECLKKGITMECSNCDAYACPRHIIKFLDCGFFCIKCIEHSIEKTMNIIAQAKKNEYWCET